MREQFKTAIEKPPEEIGDSKYFDNRVRYVLCLSPAPSTPFYHSSLYDVLIVEYTSCLKTGAQAIH